MAIDIQTGSMGESDIFNTSKERAVDKFGNPIVELGNIPDNYREGYRQYIEKNPQPQFGTGDIRDVTLPDGSNVRFSSGTSAGHFEGYLRSIGVEPYRNPLSLDRPGINPPIPQPRGGSRGPQTPMDPSITPRPGPQPQTIPASQDPSQFVQAQVGAAVRQPSLPTGTAITPGLALQAPTAATTVATQGLTGEVQATVPSATTPTTITPTTVPSASQIAQQPQVTAPQYQAVTGQAVPQATAAQGVVSQPLIAQQEDLTALPPEATVQGQLANISQAIQTSVDEGKPLPAFAQGAKRLVDAAMQQRGLGASSIAAEALATGILQSSIPIAQQDAQFYQQAIFQNLSNRQQAAVLNAQQYFQMDMQNLSNNQQASLQNLNVRQ